MILPAEQKAREEKKREMKEELAREARGKISGKKKKRLDKYIVRLPLYIPSVPRAKAQS